MGGAVFSPSSRSLVSRSGLAAALAAIFTVLT
jgi:hypothetical protein